MSFNFKVLIKRDWIAYGSMADLLPPKMYIMVVCELYLALSASSPPSLPPPRCNWNRPWEAPVAWKALTNSQGFLGCSLVEGLTILFWVKETRFHPKWPQMGKICLRLFLPEASGPHCENGEGVERCKAGHNRGGERMRLVCLGLTPGYLFGIPQLVAGLWRQEHAKKQGSPGHAEEGGGRKRERG